MYMFRREIQKELIRWKEKPERKPLVLRGARQVGKTTAVKAFAEKFDQFLYFNLELPGDREPFEQFEDIETLVQALFFLKNEQYSEESNTLIFVDEIQEETQAVQILRYFYESYPGLHVIAAGSMLETLFDQDLSFPVGRVEYLMLRPVSFPEFLMAMGETSAMEQLQTIPIPSFAQQKLLKLFHKYALIGGMPEVVAHYSKTNDLTALQSIYEGLIESYIDDVEKYAVNRVQVEIIRHVIRSSFTEAGNRITFAGFGNSSYKSREVGEALRTLEKALVLHLIYPHTGVQLPIKPDKKKKPRLHLLDTGMMNYFLNVQRELLGTDDLNKVYQGTVIEHLVGQELLAHQYGPLSSLHFWTREKRSSQAEVDYLLSFDGKLIPIEVKSGKTGTLRSLHQFMMRAPHDLAVRLYAGELSIDHVNTGKGASYQLLNLPYYLVSKIEKYIQWFAGEVNRRNG